MDETKRTNLERLRELLLFAADDMGQARAAVLALNNEEHNVDLMRALETAIAVCYARAFTDNRGWGQVPKKYRPEASDAALHEVLMHLRHKVYAHVSGESGRSATMTTTADFEESAAIEYRHGWLPLERAALRPIADLCEAQRERFLTAAASIP